MTLVDYSDSEGSGDESPPSTRGPTSTSRKPAVRHIVDRSKPHKVRVSLPEFPISKHGQTIDDTTLERPLSKRARNGAGFSEFITSLPAPKRSGQAMNGSSWTVASVARATVGRGIGLKTGATPAFSRDIDAPTEAHTKQIEAVPQTITTSSAVVTGHESATEASHPREYLEPKLVGQPLMFKPLSVVRKSPKKRRHSSGTGVSMESKSASTETKISTTSISSSKADNRARASLFSMEQHTSSASHLALNENEPSPWQSDRQPSFENLSACTEELPIGVHADLETISRPVGTDFHTSQSLHSIAADFNLSDSARRQLSGRRHGRPQAHGLTAVNIVNFDTDKEYEANEALRAAGETAQHNPVRAIVPGKHTLKQLVNAASTQANALEEAFASGRRNKREAGSKYGW